MKCLIITGPSGAGKTLALNCLEDAGFYAADNLPPSMLPAMADYCKSIHTKQMAVVVDPRCGAPFADLERFIGELRASGIKTDLLYLDTSEETLIRRFKETRRPHPFFRQTADGAPAGIAQAIATEAHLLAPARAIADRVLDTSQMTAAQFREAMLASWAGGRHSNLLVTVTSFGFKHGLPIDADQVFDVRFLANPHYVPHLQPLDGRNEGVAAYVHADPLYAGFFDRMYDLTAFALPAYIREGKAYLNVAIGCTGGQHRSITLAIDLEDRLRRDGYETVVIHRDLNASRPEVDEQTWTGGNEPAGPPPSAPGKAPRKPRSR